MKSFKSALMLGIFSVFVIAFLVLVIHLVLIGIVVGIGLFCCGWVIQTIRRNKQKKARTIEVDPH